MISDRIANNIPPQMNAGLVALLFFRGSGPVFAKKPYSFDFQGGFCTPYIPLDPHMHYMLHPMH